MPGFFSAPKPYVSVEAQSVQGIGSNRGLLLPEYSRTSALSPGVIMKHTPLRRISEPSFSQAKGGREGGRHTQTKIVALESPRQDLSIRHTHRLAVAPSYRKNSFDIRPTTRGVCYLIPLCPET